MGKKKSPLIPRKRKINLNIGLIIFAVFFIYILYNILASLFSPKVQVYEIGEVSATVKDTTYDALMIRNETAYTISKTGYVNFFIRQNARTAIGNTIYSIDESGEFTKLLTVSDDTESKLTEDQLESLKTILSVYSAKYDPNQFNSVYDLKFNMQNALLEYLSRSNMATLTEMGIDTTYLTTVTSTQTGVVEYYSDSLESMKEEFMTAKTFDTSGYKRSDVISGSLINQGDFVYKIIDSEKWYVYIPLIESDVKELMGMKEVVLNFNDISLQLTVPFQEVTLSDGTMVGKCTMNNYMVQLADKRFTSVTIMKSKMKDTIASGLKVPQSAIVTKEVYMIPESYATQGGNDNSTGFLRQVYTARGESAEFITPEIYALRDGYYYVSPDGIDLGTKLLQPEGSLVDVSSTKLTKLSPSEAESMSQALTTTAVQKVTKSKEKESTLAGGFVVEDDVPEGVANETAGAAMPQEDLIESEVSEEEEFYEDQDLAEGEDSGESDLDEESIDAASEQGSDAAVGGAGDTFMQAAVPDTGGVYVLDSLHLLKGVMNINRGYCVFKQVNILDENDDYCIVEDGDHYGIAVYDHILLNAANAVEGDIIYK